MGVTCGLRGQSWDARRSGGKHWSGETSDALVALRTLMLNREWDRYWEQPGDAVALLASAA